MPVILLQNLLAYLGHTSSADLGLHSKGGYEADCLLQVLRSSPWFVGQVRSLRSDDDKFCFNFLSPESEIGRLRAENASLSEELAQVQVCTKNLFSWFLRM
jgi:hypothetical protein